MHLGTLLDSPQNGFNNVRLVAAAAVVVTHSFLLLYDYTAVPLFWGPYDLGANAVNVFFFISGLMLSRSYELNPHWRRFAVARILRVFPALVVAGMLVGWLLAPFFTARPLADYLLDPRTLLYPLTSTFDFPAVLPWGVFPTSSQPGKLDLPLWTIKYELFAYLVFGVASAAGILRSRLVAVLLCAAFGVALTVAHGTGVLDQSPLRSVIRFGFAFLLGVSAHRYRDILAIRPLAGLLLAAAALLLAQAVVGPVLWIIATCYAGLIFASVNISGVTAFTRRTDLSFGIYIYAWPVQQVLLTMEWARDNVVLHILVALVITVVIAAASWTWVEKPALSLKRSIPTVPRPALAAERRPAA